MVSETLRSGGTAEPLPRSRIKRARRLAAVPSGGGLTFTRL